MSDFAKDTNVPANDCISRHAAINAMRNINAIVSPISDDVLLIDKAEAMTELMMLPSAQPEVIGCKDCKYRPTIKKEDGIFPLDGTALVFPEGKCPCYCDLDEYYSWIPADDFYCKYWEMDENERSD